MIRGEGSIQIANQSVGSVYALICYPSYQAERTYVHRQELGP